jgi:hypothetical protein
MVVKCRFAVKKKYSTVKIIRAPPYESLLPNVAPYILPFWLRLWVVIAGESSTSCSCV